MQTSVAVFYKIPINLVATYNLYTGKKGRRSKLSQPTNFSPSRLFAICKPRKQTQVFIVIGSR